MTQVPVWIVFAYMNDNESLDRRRVIAEWQLDDYIRHLTTRGYDNIYLTRDAQHTVWPIRPLGVTTDGPQEDPPVAA